MTLDKLVYDVREALNKFSDDSEIDNRYIIYLLNLKRAKYLKQELDRFGRKFNNTILQTFCSPIEVVSSTECAVDVGCDNIARTTLNIPNLLQLHSKDALARVSPADKLANPFRIISRNSAPFSKSSIFDYTKTFLHDDDRLYFTNKTGVFLFDCVSVTGIFEDPTDLKDYRDCCDCTNVIENSCYDIMTTDYPVSPHLLDIIRQDVIQELLQVEQVPEDKENDQINEG